MCVPMGSGKPAGFVVVLVICFKGMLELFKEVFLFPFFRGFMEILTHEDLNPPWL